MGGFMGGKGKGKGDAYEVDYYGSLFEELVFCVHLGNCQTQSGMLLGLTSVKLTSSNLKAARLLSPWTLASRANTSLPCLCFHLEFDEDHLTRGWACSAAHCGCRGRWSRDAGVGPV